VSETRRAFSTQPSELSTIRGFVRALAREGSFSDVADDLALAATEACANAILHTNGPEMTVSITTSADAIEIEIMDSGVFRPRIGVPELDGEGHRGFQLMIAMMDEVGIVEGTPSRPGTLVRLVKRKDPFANAS
jgi:anti-sigma regulatory factor (Ser/Thr protein kinase)